jgi:helicase
MNINHARKTEGYASIYLSVILNIVCATTLLMVSCHNNTAANRQIWAVIVGAGYNTSGAAYVNNDAACLYAALKPIFGENHISLLAGENATKSKLKDALLDWLPPLEDADDSILIFLAGHGSKDFFQLTSSASETLATGLTPSELSQWLDAYDSNNVVIFLDFCESGNYGTSIANDNGITVTACTGSEKSWQEKAYEHGIFSYYLMQALSNPEKVDKDGDFQISIDEIFEYIQLAMISEFHSFPPPSPQHPYMLDNFSGEFILFTYPNVNHLHSVNN